MESQPVPIPSLFLLRRAVAEEVSVEAAGALAPVRVPARAALALALVADANPQELSPV